MDIHEQFNQYAALIRAQEEERKENSLFRAAVKSAAVAFAVSALFGRRGS